MNKQTFLNELRKQLHALEEAEVEDIISEYEQHIDIKVQKGQTEEEAIKDFGSVKELSAQILSAYHVRADKGRFTGMLHEAVETGKQESRKAAESVSGYAENIGEKMPGFFARLSASIKSFFKSCAAFVKRQYHRATEHCSAFMAGLGEKRAERAERKANAAANAATAAGAGVSGAAVAGGAVSGGAGGAGSAGKKAGVNSGIFANITGMLGNLLRNTFSLIKRCFSIVVSIAIFLVIMGWNIGLVFVAGMGSIFLLMSLFCLGVLTVFMLQGYPIAGLVIGLLGVVLCCGAAVTFLLSLIVRKKSKKEPKYREPKYREPKMEQPEPQEYEQPGQQQLYIETGLEQ